MTNNPNWFRVIGDIIPSENSYLLEIERAAERYGKRNLLESSLISDGCSALRKQPELKKYLYGLVSIQATYFKKTLESNWNVGMHQDTVLPILGSGNWRSAGVKDGVSFAHIPIAILDRCIVVRLNFDEVVEGDLVIPKNALVEKVSHGDGIYVPKNGALLMKPTTYHGSRKLSQSPIRRVVHILYGPSQLPKPYSWRWAV